MRRCQDTSVEESIRDLLRSERIADRLDPEQPPLPLPAHRERGGPGGRQDLDRHGRLSEERREEGPVGVGELRDDPCRARVLGEHRADEGGASTRARRAAFATVDREAPDDGDRRGRVRRDAHATAGCEGTLTRCQGTRGRSRDARVRVHDHATQCQVENSPVKKTSETAHIARMTIFALLRGASQAASQMLRGKSTSRNLGSDMSGWVATG